VNRKNPSFPVGLDYYPIDDERRGWDDWYDMDVEADFAAFGQAGLSLVRIFISWKLFEQQVGQYDDEAEERLGRLVAAARPGGVRLLVDFFADDQLAELADVPWGRKRDPRTDDYMLQRQVSLVQRIVNRYRDERVVFGWELANEAFASGFTSEEDLRKWAGVLREAIREVDLERPILLGVDPETLFATSGVDAWGTLDDCELVTSHATSPYRAYAAEGPVTSGPATYLSSYLLRAASRDLPVLADGIGTFSLENSHSEEAANVRGALYGAVMNGAAGAMLRRYRDVHTERREPYYRDPREVLVGVADVDGVSKRSWTELVRFCKAVGNLDLRRWSPIPERVAVVVPQERFEPLPSLAGLTAARSCLQSFVAAKEAHLPVDVIREEDGFGKYLCLFVPSVSSLDDSTWQRLADFAQSGGSVVLSYGGGDAHPAVRDLFGVEFLGDSGPRSELSCRIAQPGVLGELAAFDARIELPHVALLGSGRATVVATDEQGNPLLTVNQAGQGKTVFLAAPLERALAHAEPAVAPETVRHMLRTTYGAVAAGSGAAGPVSCDVPEVEVAMFTGDEEGALLLLNHGQDEVTAQVRLDRSVVSVTDLRGGVATPVGGYTLGVPLGPNGAVALRLRFVDGGDGVDGGVAADGTEPA
jgi:endo-1,4-beta-mannosidase